MNNNNKKEFIHSFGIFIFLISKNNTIQNNIIKLNDLMKIFLLLKINLLLFEVVRITNF